MLDLELLTYLTLANYILSWLLVDAHIFDTPRHVLKRDTPMLRFGGVHIFECRTCVSFWVALGMSLYPGSLVYLLPVWALSRVLRMQERVEY